MGMFTLPPLDRDESRFAQATAQMIETGDFVRIEFQDEPRHKKPVGIHWLQVAAVTVFSDVDDRGIWAYRIPSVLGVMLAAFAAFWGGQRLVGRQAAFAGSVLFAATVLLGIEGGIAKTDAMLCGLTTLSMAALAHLRTGGGRKSALVFWLAIGGGILIKGPVTPMVAGLAILALLIWERRAGWLKPLAWWPGPLLAVAIAAPWLIAVQLATDGAFLREAMGEDLGPKLVSGHERHGGWPGYHLLLLPALFFPAVLFLVPGIAKGVTALRQNTDFAPAVRFLLAWAIPTWLVFEFLPTKLPHYVLPAYPALALLAGWALVSLPGPRLWPRWVSIALAGFGALLLSAVIVALPAVYGAGALLGAGLALVFLVPAFGAVFEAGRGRVIPALILSVAAGFAWHAAARGVAVMTASDVRLADRARMALSQMGTSPEWPVWSTYTEPSLVFSLGTETHLVEFDQLPGLLPADGSPYITIEDVSRSGDDIAVMEALDANSCAVREIPGFNYSRGDETVLIVRLHNCPEAQP
jgi:4-amino-4-deoxy-L-arabinose transferase-like glycosyltransferase